MKGRIILIPFELTDFSSSKLRPALVLHERIDDVVICFITSRDTPVSPDYIVKVPKTHTEFSQTRLRDSSIFILDKVFTIHNSLIKTKLGKVGPKLKEEINSKLQNIFFL